MRKIHVNVSKPYDVLIERGIIKELPEIIRPTCTSNRVAIVTDDIVAGLFLKTVEENLQSAGFETVSFIFQNGEQSKNIITLSDILEFLAKNHIRRNDTLIALGGGVPGDITGMAAAIYMRGISVIQVPTTLLAAVDSSVGGKTAVDLKNGKNLAGAFWQPRKVICDVEIIEKLPENIFAEGMAEVIKCDEIGNLSIIEMIRQGTLLNNLDQVIYNCVSLKRDVVEKDEFDVKGIRNILNVGHTVAHAIEKLSRYTVSHGHAVGTGLVVEAEIACQLGVCGDEVVEAIKTAVDRFDLWVDIPWTTEVIFEAMKSDKKNRDAHIVFELPHTLGKCVEIKIEKEKLIPLIKSAVGR